jgi:hypothetical protein
MEEIDTLAETLEEPSRTLTSRIVGGTVASLAAALLLWGSVHVMIPMVRPDAAAPEGHWGQPCWGCHIVSSSAPVARNE